MWQENVVERMKGVANGSSRMSARRGGALAGRDGARAVLPMKSAVSSSNVCEARLLRACADRRRCRRVRRMTLDARCGNNGMLAATSRDMREITWPGVLGAGIDRALSVVAFASCSRAAAFPKWPEATSV